MRLGSTIAKALILVCLPMSVHGDWVKRAEERCAQDSLSANEIVRRNQWAQKCFPDVRHLIGAFATRYVSATHSSGSNRAPIDPDGACEGWKIVEFCVVGCIAADQLLMLDGIHMPISEAAAKNYPVITTLANDSTLSSFKTQFSFVERYSKPRSAGDEVMRTIRMSDGVVLKVTIDHPVLLASGVMTSARDLAIGSSLVRFGGKMRSVVSIEDENVKEFVYNIIPKSGNPRHNVIVVQNYFVGSWGYQYGEYLTSLLGKQILRATLTLEN